MENNKNKILMIAPTPFFSDRGCHIRIYNEIKFLENNHYDVTLCTYHLGNNPEGINKDKIKRSINIPWYKKISPGASWHKMYIDIFLFITSFITYLSLKPNIIHAHAYEGLIIAKLINIISIRKVNIIFDCQGGLTEELYQYNLGKYRILKLFYRPLLFIEKLIVGFSDKIIVSSENTGKTYMDKIKKNKKVHLVGDGYDMDLFDKRSNVNLRKELGISKNKKIIIYTGGIYQAKGLDVIFKTIPRIIEKNKHVIFLFVGYGDLSYYINLSKRKKINKNVIFTGKVDYFNLPSYLNIADIAIDPKNNSTEASGKILNYVAAKLPIICFDNKNNRKLTNNQALYIKNEGELYEKLNNILNDKIEYHLYGEGDRLAWNEKIKTIVKIYNE